MGPDDLAIHEAFIADQEVINAATGGLADSGSALPVTIHPAIRIEFFNAIWVDPAGPAPTAAAIAAAVARTEAAGAPVYVLVAGDPTDDVLVAAASAGVEATQATPAMAVAPGGFTAPDPPVPVERIEDPTTAVALIAGGFGLPMELAAMFMNERLLAASGVATFVALDNDEPVSTATTVLSESGVGVYAVATPPASRGRGFGGAVTAAAVRAAFDRGASLAYLQSSSMGYRVYERLGFAERWRYTAFTRPVA